ncbi:glutathione S-transferase family protein [Rhodovibrionaceae bacterium A322]
MSQEPEILLHHYPPSPVSEKARLAFGIKGLAWRSVEVPRLPPKPDLMPLTAGYRRAPVMQIGADIYCDSQCILRELERRYPSPSFEQPGGSGLLWALTRWADGELMDLAVKLVLVSAAENLPPEFAKDRGRLYMGPDCNLMSMKNQLPHVQAQLRTSFGWVEEQLTDAGPYLMGETPRLCDVSLYYLVWFLRGRWAEGPEFLAQFPNLLAWESRLQDLGHGPHSDLDSQSALAIAKAATTITPQAEDPLDPQGLKPGQTVMIRPDVDAGEDWIRGPLQAVYRDKVVLLHENPQVGQVAIHFPRAGYRVEPG